MVDCELRQDARRLAQRLANLSEGKRQQVERVLIGLSARDPRTLELLRQLSGGDITVEELERMLHARCPEP